jgi:hypothetical protein
VWSPVTGPIDAYENPEHAHAHARTMVGVNVDSCELRTSLPPIVRDDLVVDYEGDNDTPVIPLDDIDDPDSNPR